MTKEVSDEVIGLMVYKINTIEAEIKDLEKLIFKEFSSFSITDATQYGLFIGYINSIIGILTLVEKNVKSSLKDRQ